MSNEVKKVLKELSKDSRVSEMYVEGDNVHFILKDPENNIGDEFLGYKVMYNDHEEFENEGAVMME